jgi:hypothetical protein
MASILWRQHDGAGLDRCVLDVTPAGSRLSGTTLAVVDGEPIEIRYSVMTDAAGATTTVGAHVQGSGNDRRLALSSDGQGTWSVSDEPVLDLFGAIDVDLGWTPATNTLPIRRLGLEIGESAQITVAMISFPQHEVERRTQAYERLDETTYRYTSATFDGTLTVNEHHLVTEHSGGWSALAQG